MPLSDRPALAALTDQLSRLRIRLRRDKPVIGEAFAVDTFQRLGGALAVVKAVGGVVRVAESNSAS